MLSAVSVATALISDGPSAASLQQRISPTLLQLSSLQWSSGASNGATNSSATSRATAAASSDFQWDAQQRVGVTITAVDPTRLLAPLQSLGFQLLDSQPSLHFLEGFLPLSQLAATAALSSQGLMGVVPIYRPQSSAGSVADQADFVLEADRVRATAPGLDGTGITVGVLSDSYNNLGGASADVTSGDLPSNVNVLQDLSSGGTDEGRAMLQLVHDIAPGASLAFATAFLSEASFAQNIRNLAAPTNGNAKVIVDDVFYLQEPFFQDGIVSKAIDDVVTTLGVAYFSSAGNQSTRAYESTSFNTAADTLTRADNSTVSGQFYDFDPSAGVDTRQRITLGTNQTFRATLQWNQPFYTLSGVTTNLDFFLIDSTTGKIVASSEDDNLANQRPVETLSFQNTGAAAAYDVAILRTAGPNPGRIKYVNAGSAVTINEFNTNSPTISQHSASLNALSVAAAGFYNQRVAESFTSQGPSTILFAFDGTALPSAQVRAKPDITSIDGSNTTFFGSDFDGDGKKNFFGTSAAAPHAAAVAALLRQANPSFTPGQIYSRLESTADSAIGAAGYDYVTGYGLIDAYRAVYGSPVASSLNVTDGFESGVLSSVWSTYSSGAGRIQVTGANSPASGVEQLTMDSAYGPGIFSLNEAVLHVNALGAATVVLTFKEKEFDDEDDVMPPTFTGSGNYDGVALSVDGTNWFRIVTLTGNNSTNSFQTQTFNLSAVAAAAGITLGADTRIKFQQYDNFPIPSDGMAFDDISVGVPAVVNRRVFYNNSAFDGNSAAANAADDAAIASDKTALLPGGTATFANYTSFNRGINGVIVDIVNLLGTPLVSDFVFRVGNDSNSANWPLYAGVAPTLTVLPSGGVNGSARIELIFPDNAVQKQWLKITVPTANTGLAAADVFYFGNAIGETGNHSTGAGAEALVNNSDLLGVRGNPHTVFNPVGITSVWDINRDKRVDASDQLAIRGNATSPFTALQLIGTPVSGGLSLAAASQAPAAASSVASPASQTTIAPAGASFASPLASQSNLATSTPPTSITSVISAALFAFSPPLLTPVGVGSILVETVDAPRAAAIVPVAPTSLTLAVNQSQAAMSAWFGALGASNNGAGTAAKNTLSALADFLRAEQDRMLTLIASARPKV